MEIVWRQIALDGLEHARRYISEHNPTAADRVFDTILMAVRRLSHMPNMGRPGRVEGIRELVFVGTPYLVAYTVIGDTLHVIAVQHGAKRWPRKF